MNAAVRLVEVRVPDMGNFKDVAVIDVLVKPGETIEPEAPLVTLETEKATMDVPSTASGVVEKIHVAKGGTVSPGDLIVTVRSTESAGAGNGAASGSNGAPTSGAGSGSGAASASGSASSGASAPTSASSAGPAPASASGSSAAPGAAATSAPGTASGSAASAGSAAGSSSASAGSA